MTRSTENDPPDIDYENDPLMTAHHEAGHAVIACVLKYPCESVTIVRNEAEDEAGHTALGDQWAALRGWEALEIFGRFEETAVRARAIVNMAGREAEIAFSQRDDGGDGYDQREAMLMLIDLYGEDDWQRYEERLRRMTAQLVARHRDKIERVAQALIERSTLSAEEINAICNCG